MTPNTSATTAIVDAVIRDRRSIRRFLDTPVPLETVEEILAVSSRAPSGTNTQPWLVYVLAGERRQALTNAVIAEHDNNPDAHSEEYRYYPKQWKEPYIGRRRKVGFDLYQLLGIQKGDNVRMQAQFARNYMFFDAPVGLFFTIDREMERGSWLDYGMFLQNVMLAAHARGMDTCIQAAFCKFHRVIHKFLELPENEMLVCGMSLGFADNSAPENQLKTERAPVKEFAKFFGFE